MNKMGFFNLLGNRKTEEPEREDVQEIKNPRVYILNMVGEIVYDARGCVIEGPAGGYRYKPFSTESTIRKSNDKLSELCAQLPPGVGEEEFLARLPELIGDWDGAA